MTTEAKPAGGPGGREVDWPGLTVEAVLYALLLIGAAGIRFYDLGRWPLLQGEAAQALAAWRFLHGLPVDGAPAPFLFGGALAGFFAFGASDATARLLPAALGTGLILVPLALRRRLGGWGALAATFALAFSPTLVSYSRTLAGPVPALAGLGAVLVAADWAARREWRTVRLLGAAGLAVALTSSPWAYTFLLAALLFFGVRWLAARRGVRLASAEAGAALLRDRGAWAALAIPLSLISTALLLRPGGLQGTADLLGTWLTSLAPGSAGRSWAYTLGVLSFYEVGVLALGLGGLALGVQRRDTWAQFLGVWALMAVLLATLAGGRDAGPAAMAVLPLTLLAGQAVNAIVPRLRLGHGVWAGGVLAVLAVLLGFWWLQLAAYGNVAAGTYYGDSLLLIGALALATPLAIVGAMLISHHWLGPVETRWAVGVVGLALAGGLLVRHSVSLNLYCARDAREPLVVEPTSVDLKDMVAFLEDWSVRRALDQHALPVAVEADLEPVVTWYLREFPLRVQRSPLDDTSAGALVVRADPERPVRPQWARQRYQLLTRAEAPLGYARQALGWWLLRVGGGSTQAEALELWVRL